MEEETSKIRVYTDHTGRYYEDYTQEEYDKKFNSPEMIEFRTIVQEEIDKEMIERMIEVAEKLGINHKNPYE